MLTTDIHNNTKSKKCFMVKLLSVMMCIFVCISCRDTPHVNRPFVFGVMADIQYADKDEGNNRYYRTSLENLQKCVNDLNERQPAFVIQLGDIIDGYKEDTEASVKDLDSILEVFNRFEMPKYHVLGNHCVLAGRENVKNKLGVNDFFYDFTFSSAPGWRFIVLDGNDAGYGVISDEQLQWLRSTLDRTQKDNEKVICFCHYALLKEAAEKYRLANPQPVLDILDDHNGVVAWFAGHDHAGGYAVRNNVHHLTFKGMVESADRNAYALVELHPQNINIIGIGDECSRTLAISR
ncbi:MAG: metallophosphoesterase [Sedimentisphaerales bacterium]|nr:metallophosphoesterase [Sedimentisphaerales bacterium]